MNLFLVSFISGASFLLSFLLFSHPFRQNVTANRWLSFFVFIIGCAFIGTFMIKTETVVENILLFKFLNSLIFLLFPSFYISILYFVKPKKEFKKIDWLHFAPFIMYVIAESVFSNGEESISVFPLFAINKDLSFLVRDILPFLSLFYWIKSYKSLAKHKKNLQLISASINQIDLDWLVQFLFMLLIAVFVWLNDTLFSLPVLTEMTNFAYVVVIFFLAYFSIKQKTIFSFREKDIKEISEVLEYGKNAVELQTNVVEVANDADFARDATTAPKTVRENPSPKRLHAEQLSNLSAQLLSLMENDKLFLDNDLNLPTVAEKLGVSIHDASFLINETTNDNFYNFVNKYRVEEAKKLLASHQMDKLNILGIAFASGFNSKTTFNTTFKNIVGVSPSQYSKEQKK